MENASKALIMAGSILIAVLVISLVMYSYNQMSDVQQAKSDAEEVTKMQNYNKKFEQYNKDIYGSELLSLANLQDDYNDIQVELKGYNLVTIHVTITKVVESDGTIYVQTGDHTIGIIRTGLSKLEDDIEYYEDDDNGYENEKENKKRSVKYYAQLSNRQIATLFEIPYSSDELDYDIGDRLESTTRDDIDKLMDDIENYKNLKTTYTEFKNTRFKCTDVVYDDVGRITSMNFVED